MATKRGNSAKRDARAADVQEKRKRALQLRIQSLTLRQVADRMGCSVSVVHEYIHDAIHDIPVEDAKEVRALEVLKYDRQERDINTCIKRAMLIGTIQALGTVATLENALTRVRERRAKLLGADAPAKVNVSVTDVTPESLAEMTDEQLANYQRELVDGPRPGARTH